MPNTPTTTPTPTPTPTPTCSPSSTGTNSVTYTITLNQQTEVQPPAKQWHMVCNGTDYGPGNYPELSVPYNSQGTFNLTITSGAGFPLNGPGKQINAIGVVGGTAKPNGAGNNSQMISVATPTSTTLSFTDLNNVPGASKLNYILYFTDGTKLDPIIDNGGCCTVGNSGSFFASEAFAIGMVVFAVLVVAYVGYRLMRAKRTGP